MKKIFAIILIVFVIGCSKPYVKPPEEPRPAMAEETKPAEVKKEDAAGEKILLTPAEVKKEEVAGEEVSSEKEKEAAVQVKEESAYRDALFDFDSYDIRTDAREIIDNVASRLKKNKSINILIEGHCDDRGTNEYNLALGEKRANAVKDYLISTGIPSNRINTLSYGEEKPVCTEQDEACWQRNRRAHFAVTK